MKNKKHNFDFLAECPKCKEFTNHTLIGRRYGGKLKCFHCGTETPAKIVN